MKDKIKLKKIHELDGLAADTPSLYKIDVDASNKQQAIENVMGRVCDDQGRSSMLCSLVNCLQFASASVDNLKKTHLVVDDSVAHIPLPSDLSHPKNSRQLDPSRFALHRPPNHTVLPLALLHSIFPNFVANVELYEPTTEDNTLVLELRQDMSGP